MKENDEIFVLKVSKEGVHINTGLNPNEQIGILTRVINMIINERPKSDKPNPE